MTARSLAACLLCVVASCGKPAAGPPSALDDSRVDESGADAPGAKEPPPSAAWEAARAAPITPASLMAHVRALPADRAVARPAHSRARRLIVERLEALGLQPQVQPFEWAGAPGAELANIELRLPGASADAPVLVICAHYDSVPFSGGADDNGSGVAAALELARRTAGRSLPGEVCFLWLDAEEVGLVGGRVWLEGLSDAERGRLLGAINLETVAYLDRRPGSQAMPPGSRSLLDPGDVGDFVLVIANQASAELAAIVALGLSAEAGDVLRTEVFDRLPGRGWVLPDSRRSDHASFWDRDVPAVMLTDTANFRNPHYHRASDLPETLDAECLAAVTRGVERALLILTDD